MGWTKKKKRDPEELHIEVWTGRGKKLKTQVALGRMKKKQKKTTDEKKILISDF